MTAISGSFLNLPNERHLQILNNLNMQEQMSFTLLVCKQLQALTNPLCFNLLKGRNFSTTDFDPTVCIIFEIVMGKFLFNTFHTLSSEKKKNCWDEIKNPAIKLLDFESGVLKICSPEYIDTIIEIDSKSIDEIAPCYYVSLLENERTSLRNFKFMDVNFNATFKTFTKEVEERFLSIITSSSHSTLNIGGLKDVCNRISDRYKNPSEFMKEVIEKCKITDIFFVENRLVIQGDNLKVFSQLTFNQIYSDKKKIDLSYIQNLLMQLAGSFNFNDKKLKFDRSLYLDLRTYINDPLNNAKNALDEWFDMCPHHKPLWFSMDSVGNFNYNLFLILRLFLTYKLDDSGKDNSKGVEIFHDKAARYELEQIFKDQNSDAKELLATFLERNQKFLNVAKLFFPELRFVVVQEDAPPRTQT